MIDPRVAALLAETGHEAVPGVSVEIDGADPILQTAYPIGEAAAVALGACGAAAASVHTRRTGVTQDVRVAVRLAAASLMSYRLQRVDGASSAQAPSRRTAADANPLVAFYRCRDGRYVHVHGATPNLITGTLKVLDCEPTSEAVAAAVAERDGQELEDALAVERTCGAMLRSAGEWAAHPQGALVGTLPRVEVIRIGDARPEPMVRGSRPLHGVRVLDLTRMLAGPTCGRTLASHGADVLHVNAASLTNFSPFVIDGGHGKLSTFLDLHVPEEVERLRVLARDADVFTQGYRSGALERRGLGSAELAELRPGIVYVSVNCYGHDGPWRERPGWEQLAQTVTGIATAHDPPQLLPAAACDYTTGYLAALGALVALDRRAREGGSWHVRASLVQTGMWIERLGRTCDPDAARRIGTVPLLESPTPNGRVLRHLGPVVEMTQTPPHWDRPTVPLGTHAPAWP